MPLPSLRGALATKQSRGRVMRPLDCFATLAMTGGELARLFWASTNNKSNIWGFLCAMADSVDCARSATAQRGARTPLGRRDRGAKGVRGQTESPRNGAAAA